MLAHRDQENWNDPRHTSPFEKSAIHFLVRCDKATHIHLIKHRIGVSVNGESARYKELKEDKFYVPSDWPEHLQSQLKLHALRSYDLYHSLISGLVEAGIDRKRAKESARFVLPHSTQIDQDVMFNFLSFMHFQTLRNHPHAQKEVRELASKMLRAVWDLEVFQHSLRAFGWDFGKVMCLK